MNGPRDLRWLSSARITSRRSPDPSTQTGCLLVVESTIVGVGYNGPAFGPQSIEDRTERLRVTVHAEPRAIRSAGVRARGAEAFVYPWPPCEACSLALIDAGVSRIVSVVPTAEQAERWGDSWMAASRLLGEAGVPLTIYPRGKVPWST